MSGFRPWLAERRVSSSSICRALWVPSAVSAVRRAILAAVSGRSSRSLLRRTPRTASAQSGFSLRMRTRSLMSFMVVMGVRILCLVWILRHVLGRGYFWRCGVSALRSAMPSWVPGGKLGWLPAMLKVR